MRYPDFTMHGSVVPVLHRVWHRLNYEVIQQVKDIVVVEVETDVVDRHDRLVFYSIATPTIVANDVVLKT